MNGSVKPKARPRIPTPDVTKDVINERFSHSPTNMLTMTSSGPVFPTSHVNQSSDMPIVGTLLLSPIKELESSSVNSTLQAGHPATAALAKAVLPATLKAAGLTTNGTSITLPLNRDVFVITSTAEPPNLQATEFPITQLIATSKEEPVVNTTTLLTTFPVHKASSFSDVSQFGIGSDQGVQQPTEKEQLAKEAELRHHSLSEPASKTSTLTKREVYV